MYALPRNKRRNMGAAILKFGACVDFAARAFQAHNDREKLAASHFNMASAAPHREAGLVFVVFFFFRRRRAGQFTTVIILTWRPCVVVSGTFGFPRFLSSRIEGGADAAGSTSHGVAG